MKRSVKLEIDAILATKGYTIVNNSIAIAGVELPAEAAAAVFDGFKQQLPTGYKKKSLSELVVEYQSYEEPVITEASGRHPGISNNYSALLAGAGFMWSSIDFKWYHKDRCIPQTAADIREHMAQWRQDEGRSLIAQMEFNPTLDAIVSALNNADNVYTDMCRRRIVGAWEYSPDYDSMRREWITRFLNELVVNHDIEEHVVMVSHFFWQVKRSLMLRPRYQNIALWISGGTGIGKTYLTQHTIIDLLGDQFSQVLVDKARMEDTWSTEALASTPLVTFSDIAKSFDDIGKLKAMVDDGTQSNRVMHSSSVSKTKQVVNFLFTSNEPLSLVIKDASMRRWWEIPCQRPDNDKLDSVWLSEHFLDFMKSINDDLDQGYHNENSGLYDSIAAIQNSNSTTRDVECWCAESLALSDDMVSIASLYESYKADNKDYPVSKSNFEVILKKLKYRVDKHGTHTVNARVIMGVTGEERTGGPTAPLTDWDRKQIKIARERSRHEAELKIGKAPSISAVDDDFDDGDDITDEILNGKK